ncbi:ankyrin repeat-containing domain protein [Aspergillus carlsbadensis]|nr:ankyrin repeat-containing domain protein [Aspergillus carlsbadensis]
MPRPRSIYALPPELIALVAGTLCAIDKVNLLRAFPLLLPVFPRRIILQADGHGTERLDAASPEYSDSPSAWGLGEAELGADGLAAFAGAGDDSTYIGCPDTDTDTDASSPRSPIYMPSPNPGSRAGAAACEGNTMLHVLAQSGELRLLRAIAAIHSAPPLPVDSVNHRDRTSISLACEAGHLSTVRFLADCSPSGLVTWDAQDVMPISWAAREGHAGVVRYLLSRREMTRLSPTYWFQDPACVAARLGRADVVEALVEALNLRSAQAQVPTHGAAAVEGGEAVDDQQDATRYAWLPLRYAINEGDADIVEKLLELKTLDTSSRGMGMPWRKTPLFLACRRGHARIVELLLARDSSDINAADPGGRTALARARDGGKVDVVQVLVAWGAEG